MSTSEIGFNDSGVCSTSVTHALPPRLCCHRQRWALNTLLLFPFAHVDRPALRARRRALVRGASKLDRRAGLRGSCRKEQVVELFGLRVDD
jgi:hypothetical protein